MSNELQTRDKQNQEVNSSEQYAINVIDNKALQFADYVLKESKGALKKDIGKRDITRSTFLRRKARKMPPLGLCDKVQ